MPREARRANKINREKNKQSSNARSAMAWFLFCAHNTYYQVHSHFRYFMQIITSLWCAYASTWIHTSVIISAECTAHCTTTTQRMETFFFIFFYLFAHFPSYCYVFLPLLIAVVFVHCLFFFFVPFILLLFLSNFILSFPIWFPSFSFISTTINLILCNVFFFFIELDSI